MCFNWFPKLTSPKHYWNVWKIDVECQNIHFICVSIRFPEIPPQKTIEMGQLLAWQHWISQDERRPKPTPCHGDIIAKWTPVSICFTFMIVGDDEIRFFNEKDFLFSTGFICFNMVPEVCVPKHNWNVWRTAIGYQSISFLCVSIGFPKPTSPKHYWKVWKLMSSAKTFILYVFQYGFQRSPLKRLLKREDY